MDHCFYTGTVRHDPNRSEPDTFVAVDTCQGLRGLIQTSNSTYGILPLRCTQCPQDRLPHVVFPHDPSPIERVIDHFPFKNSLDNGGGGINDDDDDDGDIDCHSVLLSLRLRALPPPRIRTPCPVHELRPDHMSSHA
ncbi:unnamed protein product [Echinostoma caproni]|uniref:Uncharacterized protein n=1 Tax=Echinostoma caproni TaxID=27848 RepID=A0A3P8IR69_9TREM|nr:unnamed protein product [Echinostoma caproni]